MKEKEVTQCGNYQYHKPCFTVCQNEIVSQIKKKKKKTFVNSAATKGQGGCEGHFLMNRYFFLSGTKVLWSRGKQIIKNKTK